MLQQLAGDGKTEHLPPGKLNRRQVVSGIGQLISAGGSVVSQRGLLLLAQEVQVAHQGAAGNPQFASKRGAVGQSPGAGACPHQFQDAAQAVILAWPSRAEAGEFVSFRLASGPAGGKIGAERVGYERRQ